MPELKDELASLRIDRDTPRPARWRLPLILIVLLGVAVAGGLYFAKAHPVFGAIEVETVQAKVESGSGANAGTPILTASGYLVARRQSVVSSKIQGRISSLRVEEGSVVKEGDVLATLDNADALAAITKAKADIEYAKADLAEAQRQERLQEDLYRSKVVSQDALDAAKAKVNLAAAAIEQDQAKLQVQQAYLDFTTVRAPFAGVVVKKMTEMGESVAPIPPGVNISTSSGAIVAIADMNSLEAEVDVNESNVSQLGTQSAGGNYGAGDSQPHLQRRAAADYSHRRPDEGDGDGEGLDPGQGQVSASGDELQRDLPGAAEEDAERRSNAAAGHYRAQGCGDHARRQVRRCS